MAADVAALMTHLGFEKFAILSHDRGARVGYRTALDYPDRVTRYVSLDVVPTHDMWLGTDKTARWVVSIDVFGATRPRNLNV